MHNLIRPGKLPSLVTTGEVFEKAGLLQKSKWIDLINDNSGFFVIQSLLLPFNSRL